MTSHIINSAQISNCYSPDVVLFDRNTNTFYIKSEGGDYEIFQTVEQEPEMFTVTDAHKILEMMNDWEKDKYPERFL